MNGVITIPWREASNRTGKDSQQEQNTG